MKVKSSFFYRSGVQSVLFAIGIYLMALVFSLFICASIFQAFTGKSQSRGTPAPVKKPTE